MSPPGFFCILGVDDMKFLCLVAVSIVGMGNGVLKPIGATQSVSGDADDPAFWICARDSSLSLIIGTDKVAAKDGGGLYVFNLDGELNQPPQYLENPNNVDVEQGVRMSNGGQYDLAIAAERGKRRLAIFTIDPYSGRLRPVSGNTQVFEGAKGEQGAPMGVSLYKRPRDGALFAIVSRKEGPTRGYLHQYRIVRNANGQFDAKFVRAFGNCMPGGEIEALLVDDELGFVYAAEEKFGIRKYAADPDAPNANRELAVFGRRGFPEDREGLGLYRTGPKTGYILCSDQREGGSYLRVFPREGATHPELAAIPTTADGTDGIEVTSTPLGPAFPKGMVSMMDSKRKRFIQFPWEKVAANGKLFSR